MAFPFDRFGWIRDRKAATTMWFENVWAVLVDINSRFLHSFGYINVFAYLPLTLQSAYCASRASQPFSKNSTTKQGAKTDWQTSIKTPKV